MHTSFTTSPITVSEQLVGQIDLALKLSGVWAWFTASMSAERTLVLVHDREADDKSPLLTLGYRANPDTPVSVLLEFTENHVTNRDSADSDLLGLSTNLLDCIGCHFAPNLAALQLGERDSDDAFLITCLSRTEPEVVTGTWKYARD